MGVPTEKLSSAIQQIKTGVGYLHWTGNTYAATDEHMDALKALHTQLGDLIVDITAQLERRRTGKV